MKDFVGFFNLSQMQSRSAKSKIMLEPSNAINCSRLAMPNESSDMQ